LPESAANLKPKAFNWWREHGGDLVQKVRLEHLEEEIIDLWHYVYALKWRLKDQYQSDLNAGAVICFFG